MIALVVMLGMLGAGQDDGARVEAPSSFWSFQPAVRRIPPQAGDAAWVRNPVDAFVLARLERAGLSPAPEATTSEWIRRLYFDLLGLPPKPEEIEDFLADETPGACERLVDRLLASPRYGERWAQHWLDVVRYAETEGFEYDRALPGMWRYRDWVIASLNADKPYDRFVTEQLAGDEAPESVESESARLEGRVAAGFHRLGAVRRNAGNQEVASSRNEVLTERTDIVGAVFLGLTLGCARCHDHKFDPLQQEDYYGLQAFLAATREHNLVVANADEQAAWQAKTAATQKAIEGLRQKLDAVEGAAKKRLEEKLADLEEQLPRPLPTVATIRNDLENPTAIHVLRRGDWQQKGAPMSPRVPGVLATVAPGAPPAGAAQPKTALASWLTDPEHPLTARVLVNRLWQYHMGTGIVDTPNDFGVNGGRPSHPWLLDFLAHELVRGGWRLKPLHRMIVLSATYRQSSRVEPSKLARETDPDNRLLWRFHRRRLTAEEIRDAMLRVSGRLNLQAGGPSVIVPVDRELVDLLYKPSQWSVTKDPCQHDRRSVYLFAKRNLPLPFMEVFDGPAMQTSCARRESSTHARQSLELLNGRLSNRLAAAFAERLLRQEPDAERRVTRAYLLATGRAPNPAERRLAVEFLKSNSLTELALAMFSLNAFLYVE